MKGKIERNLKEAGSLDSVGKRGSKERGNWPVTEGKRANFGWGLSLRSFVGNKTDHGLGRRICHRLGLDKVY